MVNPRPFGLRGNPPRQPMRAREDFDAVPPGKKSVFTEASVDQSAGALAEIASPRVDHELQEWRQSRKQRFKLPWRQLSLMAALCFGIASFALPDSVNENLDWLLYGLLAASLYAGLSGQWRT